jgi:predicted ATP-grasp superfamily ATP-dependent carboligase
VIGGAINGLGVIRNLGRNGVDVCCLVDKKDEAVYSRYCKEYFVLPGVDRDFQQLATFLTKFERRLNGQAVLFPTSDISVLNVCSLISEMDTYLASVSSKEVLEMVVRKRSFYNSLSTNGVPHPVTLFPDTSEELRSIINEVEFPVFVKPSMSQTFARKFGRKGFVANSENELIRYLQLMKNLKIDVMLQEIVPGLARNHYFIDGYLDKNSRPIGVFARRRIRMWPPSFGNSTVCVSVPISEVRDMAETVVSYLSTIGFRGIFSAEFKRDPRDNVGKLLEVNARSWWYNSFPSACGVNIILMAYLGAIGQPLQSVENYELDTHLIYFREDLKSALTLLSQRSLSFRDWVAPMIGKRDWAIFARDDPNPFVMNALDLTRAARKGLLPK